MGSAASSASRRGATRHREARSQLLEHPLLLVWGWVLVGRVVEGEEDGEEVVEVIEAYACRRCASEAGEGIVGAPVQSVTGRRLPVPGGPFLMLAAPATVRGEEVGRVYSSSLPDTLPLFERHALLLGDSDASISSSTVDESTGSSSSAAKAPRRVRPYCACLHLAFLDHGHGD